MKKLNAMIAASFLCGVAGCMSYGNMGQNEKLDANSKESIIVLGIQPRYRVAIGRGTVLNGKIKIGNGGFATLNVYPEDGYIVGKIPAAVSPDEYHIGLILPEGITVFAPKYSPCGEEQAISFTAPPGKIVYVGTVIFSTDTNALHLSYSMNYDAAEKFVEQHYPQFAGRLEKQTAQGFPFAGSSCTPAHITIPLTIYVGK